jgi:hypothetical protein
MRARKGKRLPSRPQPATPINNVGGLITLVAGVLQYVFWFVAWADWLGLIGVILGFILTPGVVIFPIIYWIVEGDFPTLYFALMFAGWFGLRLKRS